MSELMRSMMRRGGQGDGCRWVCHKCDRPPCCNPDHLFVGTQLDNVADMLAKGRNQWRYQ